MNILFIVPYSSEGASNRYRVEQYLPYIKGEGMSYDIVPFVFKKFYKVIYMKGRYLEKIVYFTIAVIIRMLNILKLYKYDLVFIHREACPIGPPVFEWLIHKLKKPIIFDFDDAIFMPNFNPANRFCNFLKSPSKTKAIIKMSSKVIVANKFLKEYVLKFNPNVCIIPTPIDTDKFSIIKRSTQTLTVGWIGSPTTAPYLQIIYGVMQKLSQKYDFIFKIVGASEIINITGVRVENCVWQLDRELQDFRSLDIGVYPLPDNLWAQGKAGFKAIQYMSIGVPFVASPVGILEDFIKDGVNGFFARSEDEWIEKISLLLQNKELRTSISSMGRKTVEERFSLNVVAPKFLSTIRKVANE